MTDDRLLAYRAAIDDELRHLGAEPETERDARLRAAEARWDRFRSALTGPFII